MISRPSISQETGTLSGTTSATSLSSTNETTNEKAAATTKGATSTVYASWNGATEVATWVVLGGDSPDALMALGSRPRMGFETAIVVLGRPRLVAVRAIDGSGAVLAQSPLVSA